MGWARRSRPRAAPSGSPWPWRSWVDHGHEAPVSDLELLGRQGRQAGAQRRPCPAHGERALETPAAHGLAVRALESDDGRRTLAQFLRLLEPPKQRVLAGDAALEDQVAVLDRAAELVREGVLAALVVLHDLVLDGQAAALGEAADRHAPGVDGEAQAADELWRQRGAGRR